jgi:hypothetical protein
MLTTTIRGSPLRSAFFGLLTRCTLQITAFQLPGPGPKLAPGDPRASAETALGSPGEEMSIGSDTPHRKVTVRNTITVRSTNYDPKKSLPDN